MLAFCMVPRAIRPSRVQRSTAKMPAMTTNATAMTNNV
jgi:hypothetical protein